jgi:hypothetical protein
MVASRPALASNLHNKPLFKAIIFFDSRKNLEVGSVL